MRRPLRRAVSLDATLAEGDVDRFATPGGASIEVTVVWDWPHFTLTVRPPGATSAAVAERDGAPTM